MHPAGSSPFIFHDPSGRRWVRFQRITGMGAIVAVLFIALVTLVAFTGSQLPALGLPAVPQLSKAPETIGGRRIKGNRPYRMPKPSTPLRYVRSASPVLHPRPAARAVEGAPLVWGFYVNWDPSSIVSLRLHLNHLTHLAPEWLTLQNSKGDLDDQSDPTVIAIARQAKLPIIALLTNFRNGWKPADVSRAIGNPATRRDLIENIRANLAEHQFAGVNIDFEELRTRDREPLIVFMRELAEVLHKSGYIVSEDVPIDDDTYDLKRLAEVNDYLVPMVYDEHYQSGQPGPVASEAWFENQIDKLARLVPPAKVIAGLGNYGYDWVIGGKGSEEQTFDDVMAAATLSKSQVQWDRGAGNPVLRYTANGKRHELWFLDAVTALNQVIAARDEAFRGVGLWRLGAEDPGLWKVLARETWPGDRFRTADLEILEASQQTPRHQGQGEILRVAESPHAGARRVMPPPTDHDDFIELYTQLPTPWVIEHSGSSDEKILCLTFDDGPDPVFTPVVLDILKARHVEATFFVIGVNAENNPGLIRREYAEGHQIGNHTYTHPNVATISLERTALELTTTQRIIENLLGVSTTFFRPPYNADSEPQTPEEIVPIERAQNFGYTTVAETIDPRDWQPGLSTDGIVTEINNEIANGHVILLHDAGGDRASTIRALPLVIDRYTKLGYRFTTIADLLGKTRAEVMPKPKTEEMQFARLEGQTLGAQARFRQALGILFLAAIYLTLARSLAYGFFAVLQKLRERHARYDATFLPPVSVVIAAYNEEKVIVRTIESILQNGYRDLEIVAVDDGSKDGTLRGVAGTLRKSSASAHSETAERRQVGGAQQCDRTCCA